MDANTTKVRLTKTKDCRGSVRFDVAKTDGAPSAIDNAYVNRVMPGINNAQEIEVTITVIR